MQDAYIAVTITLPRRLHCRMRSKPEGSVSFDLFRNLISLNVASAAKVNLFDLAAFSLLWYVSNAIQLYQTVEQ